MRSTTLFPVRRCLSSSVLAASPGTWRHNPSLRPSQIMPCFPSGVACLRVQTNFDRTLLHYRCSLKGLANRTFAPDEPQPTQLHRYTRGPSPMAQQQEDITPWGWDRPYTRQKDPPRSLWVMQIAFLPKVPKEARGTIIDLRQWSISLGTQADHLKSPSCRKLEPPFHSICRKSSI